MPMKARDLQLRVDDSLRVNAEAAEQDRVDSPPTYDRMSASGRCVRDRWATLNGVPNDPGKAPTGARIQRIFAMGHGLESTVVGWLENAGVVVHSDQLEVGSGDWRGHIDGIAEWTEGIGEKRKALLEIKTCNARSYEKLVAADGGYCEWNPGYSAQIQAYLKHLPELSEALVVVLNKDDSQLWVEHVLEDTSQGDLLLENHKIVMQKDMPPRPKGANGPGSKFCKWKCDRSDWCYSPLTDSDWS